MAVKKPAPKKTPLIRDFWPIYHRQALVMTILMELVITLIIGTSLLVAGIPPDNLAFWITLLASALTTTFLNYILMVFLLTPLRDLSMAITSVAGQKPTTAPSNPNIPRYAENGFKQMLLYVYAQSQVALPADQAAEDSAAPAAYSQPSTDMLLAALGETKAGVVVMNSIGDILYANKAAPVKTDTDGKQVLELSFESETALTDWLTNCRETAVRSEQSWQRIPNRIVGDEDRRIFDVTANYEKGSAAEVVLIMYDTTNLYKPEDDDLDFISFAAHELRGPITVIRGYLDVLALELDGEIAPDQRELFQRLTVSANRLSGYINNILNASRFDRRHLQIHLAEDTLGAIYDTIQDDMQLRASAQHRLLSVDIPADLPMIAADRSSMSEVISNLIDNALKYSNEGGLVSLTARVENDMVRVSVIDNGIGIPANVIGNLFHKFYRSHRSRETVAGTGIGLYICKAIVESHGGKIGVSSIEGKGSTFWFTIPTYTSVANKLQANDYTNAGLISSSDGWIKNHTKYTG